MGYRFSALKSVLASSVVSNADISEVVDVFYSGGQSNDASRGNVGDYTGSYDWENPDPNIQIWVEPTTYNPNPSSGDWQDYDISAKNNLVSAESGLESAIDWITDFGTMYYSEFGKAAYFQKYSVGGTSLYEDAGAEDWNTNSVEELTDISIERMTYCLPKIRPTKTPIYISPLVGNDITGNGSLTNPYLTNLKAQSEATTENVVIRLNFWAFHQGEKDSKDEVNALAWGTEYSSLRTKIRSNFLIPAIVNTIHPDIDPVTYPFSSETITNQKGAGRYLYDQGDFTDQSNGSDNNTFVNDLGYTTLKADDVHIDADSQASKGVNMYNLWRNHIL